MKKKKNLSFHKFYKETNTPRGSLHRYIKEKLFIEGEHFTKELKLHNFYWELTPEGEKTAKKITKQKRKKPYYFRS